MAFGKQQRLQRNSLQGAHNPHARVHTLGSHWIFACDVKFDLMSTFTCLIVESLLVKMQPLQRKNPQLSRPGKL